MIRSAIATLTVVTALFAFGIAVEVSGQTKKKQPAAPVAGQDDPKHDPKNAVKNLDVHPELQATLFASELDGITNPTNLDVDHRGRVWICDVKNYRGNNGSRPEGDRILILEDTDGDGKCDKVTTFYQGRDIDSAMGICVLGDKIIVSASPNVFVFTKDDNDKVVKKEVLFSKTGIRQHDHTAHSFVFGPDGRLYWNFGNEGHSVHDKDGKQIVDLAGNAVNDSGKPYRQGMVFRMDTPWLKRPPLAPPSKGGEKPLSPPSKGAERAVSPPTEGGEKPLSPPSKGAERAVSPPTEGGGKPLSPPSNGGERVVSPPSEGGVGGVWPDASKGPGAGVNFETLAWNFRNNYEVCVDSFGTMWQSDNDDDGNRGVRINYVMEYGNYGYVDEMTGAGWQTKRTNMEKEIPLRHWHQNDPGVVPNLLQTGAGSPTGICVYEGTLLPKVFQGQMIHCDAGPSVVRCYPVVKDGAGYKVTQIVNILDGEKKNNWFRPADVCVAPDGSLFVTDWYDPGVGGHAQRDLDRGRIFRVTPKSHPNAQSTFSPGSQNRGGGQGLSDHENGLHYTSAPPSLPGTPGGEGRGEGGQPPSRNLVASATFLPSPPECRGREEPTALVQEKGMRYVVPKYDFTTAEGAVEALKSPNLATRYLAWTALHEMGAKAEPALLKAWKSEDVRLRARALWLLGRLSDKRQHYIEMAYFDKNKDIGIVAVRLARQMRQNVLEIPREVLVGLLGTDFPSLAAARDFAIALRHSKDSSAPNIWALLAFAHNGRDRWYLECLGVSADENWDPCLDAYLSMNERIEKPARDIIWRSRSSKTPELLAQILTDAKIPFDELPRMLRAFDFQKDSPQKQAALVKLAFGDYSDPERRQFITSEALARIKKLDLKNNPEHAAVVNKLLDRSRGTPTFVEMVGKFSVAERYPELLGIAQQHPGEQLGVDAMRLLLERNAKLVQPGLADKDVKVALATVEAIGNAANPNANQLLLPIVEDKKADMELRRQATRALARTKPGALELVKLAREKRLDEQLKFAAASGISALPGDDVRSQAFGLLPFTTNKAALPIAPINILVKQKGNAANGKLIFAKQGTCANCHVVNGVGKEVGPNLSEIGKKLSKEALYESILYPSAGISHNYETHLLETKKGDVVQGILISQTPAEVTLKDKDAILRTFKRSEIETLTKSPISLMPADLHQTMTTQELADVVEYLLTLREAGKK